MINMFSHQNNIEEDYVASQSIYVLESRMDKYHLKSSV